MLKRRLNNRYTGIYRTPDVIDNLKIRITLKKLYSMIHIPKFEKIQSCTSNDEPSIDYVESVEIKWQEKILSKTELKYYESKENCKTELEKRYHEMTKESSNVNENSLIFTYIHEDSYVAKGLEELENCKIIRQKDSKSRDELKEFTEMYIMADLEPTILLFSIKYRKSDGLFIVFPDFNDSDNCYYKEIDQNSKQMYTYQMENISKVCSKATKKIKQKQKIDELMIETSDLMKKMINPSNELDGINLPKCRILLLFEIISAEKFEYDNIHVRFRVKIPKFTNLVEGILEGSSHSSFRNQDVYHFGYCFPIILDIKDEFSYNAFEPEKVSIAFDVVSIDSLWQRERNEGSTLLRLPLNTLKNSFEYDLNCFRHIKNGNQLVDMFERFFLGGIRSINHNSAENKNLYGNLTVSTGVLKVKVQQIKQIQESAFINTQLQSIDTIINSYHKAKEKLNI